MKNGVFIVPTGIGASIGGYAGDAGKWVRKLSKKCKLIVNPNVVNAACFSAINDNMLYVEGYTLDEFFKGNCSLIPTENNKIGVVFDKAISQDVLNVHINTINAVQTVYGIDVNAYEITDDSVGVEFYIDNSGISVGKINNLDTLKHSAQNLINNGCNAIAIVCRFPEEEEGDYINGKGVDPVGGIEAVISHYISRELQVPCAHAPAFDNLTIQTDIVSPKCAAEYITPTFLPCILIGLSQAPLISKNKGLTVEDIDFLVVPHNALGGVPVLEAHKKGIKIYAIRENDTILDVKSTNFNITCDIINTYSELLELI